jgi:hypothetical protein
LDKRRFKDRLDLVVHHTVNGVCSQRNLLT